MKNRIWIKTVVTILLTTIRIVQGEENSTNSIVRTEEVVVSATRTERSRSEVPVSIESVSSTEVLKRPAQSTLEVLRDIPGVTISDNGGNGLKYIRIRGESTRRTLILVDGQPLSQQKSMEGGIPLIGKSQIERIEVVKGPSSVLYGSEAIGGVINIITKKGGNKPIGGSANVSYDSSNNGFRQDYEVHGNVKGVEYAFSYGGLDADDRKTPTRTLDSDGTSIRNPAIERKSGSGSESDEYSAYLGYRNEKIHTGIRYDYFDMAYEVFSERTEQPMFGPWVDVYMNIPMSERQKLSGFFELSDLTEHLKKIRIDAYRQEVKRDFDIWTDFVMIPMPNFTAHTRIHNEQLTHGGTLQTDWEFGNHYVVAGLNGINDDIDGTTKSKDRTGFPPAPPTHYEYDAEMFTTAAFLQDEWSLTEGTRLLGGMRFTYVDSKFNGTDDPSLTVSDSKSKDDNISFSLGAVQQMSKAWSLRVNYSQGYRHPNLVELYIGSPAHGSSSAKDGNPDLDPETSHNFEVGTLYQGDNLSTEFAVFYTTAKDYIATDNTHYANIGGADTLGAEWSIEYRLGESGITPYANLTALHRTLDYGAGSTVDKTSDSGVAPFSGRYGVRYMMDISAMSYLNFDLFGRSTTKEPATRATAGRPPTWRCPM